MQQAATTADWLEEEEGSGGAAALLSVPGVARRPANQSKAGRPDRAGGPGPGGSSRWPAALAITAIVIFFSATGLLAFSLLFR